MAIRSRLTCDFVLAFMLLNFINSSKNAICLFMLLLSILNIAKADVWGFVDSDGITHVSATQSDERYTLFYRDPNVKTNTNTAITTADIPSSATTRPLLTPRLAEFFESSPRYRQVQPMLKAAARTYRVDYELLKAVIATESAFNSGAVSPKGAIGLMQVMPDTARRFGIESDRWSSVESKLTNPLINIQAGTRYLRYLLDLYPDQLDLVLASYNAGEGAVQRAGNAIPNFKETQAYVLMVRQIYAALMPAPSAKTFPETPINAQPITTTQGGARGRGNMLPPLQVQITPMSSIYKDKQ
jgi:hypothetical protein